MVRLLVLGATLVNAIDTCTTIGATIVDTTTSTTSCTITTSVVAAKTG